MAGSADWGSLEPWERGEHRGVQVPPPLTLFPPEAVWVQDLQNGPLSGLPDVFPRLRQGLQGFGEEEQRS